MATATTSTKTQTATGISQAVASNDQKHADLGSFLKAVKAVANSTVLEDLIAVSEDNKILKQDNAANIRQLSRLQVNLDKAEKEAKEKDTKLTVAQREYKELSTKFGETSKRLASTEKKVAQVQAETEKHLEAARKDVAARQAEVIRLSKFSVTLTPILENKMEINTKLLTIWSSALALAETYFNVDFPAITLITGSEVSQWDRLKDHKAVRNIPLPLSNSSTAKHMRVAAFLALLSHELRRHIFQPTYFLRNCTEINDVLEELAEHNPEQESYLRSVLLKASGWVPGTLQAVTQSCATAVRDNVANCVVHLIPEAQKPGFLAQLEKHCLLSCQQWAYLQKLSSRVEFDTEAEEEDTQVWKPLALKSSPTGGPPPASTTGQQQKQQQQQQHPPPPPESASSQTKRNTSATTAAAAAAAQTNVTTNKKTPIVPKPPSPPIQDTLSLTDPLAVWPSVYFYDYAGNDTHILAQGYMLTAAQIATALTEQKQLLACAPHRLAREKGRRSRTLSMSMGMSSMGANSNNNVAGGGGEEVRSGFLGGVASGSGSAGV
ncbi:hypothetical protein QBC43DRAFT_335082 [Cladorrhinum sp. PSN259]|nr:hypothetical protein QBC43DRAFT_335082 [Cladorrhinum sp. PSN259]